MAALSSRRTESAASMYASLAMLTISRLFCDWQTASVSVWMKCFTRSKSFGSCFTRSRYFGISSRSMRVGCFLRSFVMVWRSGSPSGVSLSMASCS